MAKNTQAVTELLKLASPGGVRSPTAASESSVVSPVDLLNMFTSQSERISQTVLAEVKASMASTLLDTKDAQIKTLTEQLAKLSAKAEKLTDDLIEAKAAASKFEAMSIEREAMIKAERSTALVWHQQAEAMRSDNKTQNTAAINALASWR